MSGSSPPSLSAGILISSSQIHGGFPVAGQDIEPSNKHEQNKQSKKTLAKKCATRFHYEEQTLQSPKSKPKNLNEKKKEKINPTLKSTI